MENKLPTPEVINSDMDNPEVEVMNEIFEMELTAANIGELGRLTIPLVLARKGRLIHAPFGKETYDQFKVKFVDREKQEWIFSCQRCRGTVSYVITEGWASFVEAKKLKEGDTITLHACVYGDGSKFPYQVIDFRYNDDDPGGEFDLNYDDAEMDRGGVVVD